MTRFFAPNLSRLPPPDAVQVPNFETLLAARKADILERVRERVTDAELLADLEAILMHEQAEPIVIVSEVQAEREVIVHERINDGVRAVLHPTSRGADLDNLQSWLVTRLERPADATTTPPTPAWVESDAEFRQRFQLALEAFSTAGPEGAYLYHARTASADVKDVAAYGPHDQREAVFGNAASVASLGVSNGHVRIVVLSRIGNGAASAALLTTVAKALAPKDVRPLGDYVQVQAATILPYTVNVTLRVTAGAATAPIIAEARRRIAAVTDDAHKVGAVVTTSAIDAAASCADADGFPVVPAVIRTSPAANVDPGAWGAPFCASITVNVEVIDG